MKFGSFGAQRCTSRAYKAGALFEGFCTRSPRHGNHNARINERSTMTRKISWRCSAQSALAAAALLIAGLDVQAEPPETKRKYRSARKTFKGQPVTAADSASWSRSPRSDMSWQSHGRRIGSHQREPQCDRQNHSKLHLQICGAAPLALEARGNRTELCAGEELASNTTGAIEH